MQLRPIPLLLFFALTFTSRIWADDAATAKRLDDAKSAFEREQDRLRQDVTAALKKKEDDIRKAGDLQGLERIRAEIEAFEVRDEVPTLVSVRIYEEGIKKARAKLEAALKLAIKEYTKTDSIDRAKETQAELEDFKSGKQPVAPNAVTKGKLRELLEGTTWQPSDPKFWFRLNPDGTVTPGWHSNNACLWTVSSPSTIKVQIDSERHVQTMQVDIKNGRMTDIRGDAYRRTK